MWSTEIIVVRLEIYFCYIKRLFVHIRVAIDPLTTISLVELVWSANLEVRALLLLCTVAVGLLTYFLYRSLLGIVGDTAHIEVVLDVLQILAITVE